MHQRTGGRATKRSLRMRALAAITAAGAIAVGGGALPAGAVPQRGDAFVLDCDLLGTIDVVTNPGNGLWTPGFVVGSNQRLIPYAFEFTFTPTGGAAITEEISKPAPRNGRLDRCTFSETTPEGTLDAVVWVSYTR